MKQNDSFFKKIAPLFIFFILVNCSLLAMSNWLQNYNINADVVIAANCILFLISSINIAMQKKALENKNPNAVVRSVMGGTLLKLMVISFTILIYLFMAGSKRNSYGIFCGMILYLVYTVIEVRIATKMKKK